jgi:hypothetical protein
VFLRHEFDLKLTVKLVCLTIASVLFTTLHQRAVPGDIVCLTNDYLLAYIVLLIPHLTLYWY